MSQPRDAKKISYKCFNLVYGRDKSPMDGHRHQQLSGKGTGDFKRKAEGSNPGCGSPTLCPWEKHFTRISSLHPSVKGVPIYRQ